MKSSLFFTASVPLLLGVALALSGCRSSAPVLPSTPAVSVRTASLHPAATDPHLIAVAHVQAMPLYQQAQAACAKQQFAVAAGLLDRLAATPDLNDLERAFCREQQNLCRRDAGLPVAPEESRKEAQKTQTEEAGKPLSESADCGPRALLLLGEKLGVRTDLATLKQKAGITEKGTSLQGLADAIQAVGLKSEGVQLSREELARARMPAIAWVNGNHYLCVGEIKGGVEGTAVIRDPNQMGDETIPLERLLRMSSGYLLLIHR